MELSHRVAEGLLPFDIVAGSVSGMVSPLSYLLWYCEMKYVVSTMEHLPSLRKIEKLMKPLPLGVC